MGFFQDIKVKIKAAQDRAEVAHRHNIAVANAKARSEIARSKTELQRQSVKLQLARDKAAINKQLAQAKMDIASAKAEANRSRIAAGNLTVGERIAKAGRAAGSSRFAQGLARDAQKAGKSLFTNKPSRTAKSRTAKRRSSSGGEKSSMDDLFDTSGMFGEKRRVVRKTANATTKRKTVKRKTR